MKKTTNVADDIKQKIISGQLTEGDKLPSIKKLAELCEVSTMTVRNAIEQLTLEGFIETRERSGCYVKAPNQKLLSMTLDSSYNILDEIIDIHALDHILVQDFPPALQGNKCESHADHVVKIDWLYTTFFNAPVVYEECFLVEEDPKLVKQLLSIDDRAILEEHLGKKSKTTLNVYLILADSTTQEHLHLEEGAYVFLFEKIAYTADGKILALSRAAVLSESTVLHASN